MRRLTVQEQLLIFAILAILVVGACVNHCRRRIVKPDIPEFPNTTASPEAPEPGHDPDEE